MKERRKFRRRPVLESFSLFVTIPRKGGYRLPIHDISDEGIGFDFDLEGESLADFPLKTSEQFEIQFYLNQTLFLPLQIDVVRIEQRGEVRRVGAKLVATQSPEVVALRSFLGMLDSITEAAQIQQK